MFPDSTRAPSSRMHPWSCREVLPPYAWGFRLWATHPVYPFVCPPRGEPPHDRRGRAPLAQTPPSVHSSFHCHCTMTSLLPRRPSTISVCLWRVSSIFCGLMPGKADSTSRNKAISVPLLLQGWPFLRYAGKYSRVPLSSRLRLYLFGTLRLLLSIGLGA